MGKNSYLTSQLEQGWPWRKKLISFGKTQSLSRFGTAVVSKFHRIVEQAVPNRAEQVGECRIPESRLFAQWQFPTLKLS